MKTEKFPSEAIPGATFTLRVMGRQLRNQIELSLVDYRHQQRLILQEQASMLPASLSGNEEEIDKAIRDLSPTDSARLDILTGKGGLLAERVRLGYLQVMLVSFELPGPEYADVRSTDQLLDYGPEEFVIEVGRQAEKMWSMSVKEKNSSNSPSTSQEAAGGSTTDGTAIVASSEATT